MSNEAPAFLRLSFAEVRERACERVASFVVRRSSVFLGTGVLILVENSNACNTFSLELRWDKVK